jgi:subtilisin family serine protease
MAAPHATGVAALIRAAHPGMPVGAVQAILQNTAMPKDCPTAAEMDPRGTQTCTGGAGHNSFYGKGLVDALAAGSA